MSTRRVFLQEMTVLLASPAVFLLESESGSAYALASTAAIEGRQAEVAVPADSFVESIGVGGHLTWRQSVWGRAEWQPLFLELGVRAIRTAVGARRIGRAAAADLNLLYDEGGIRADVLVGPSRQGQFNIDAATAMLELLSERVGQEKIIGIEGPNEANNPREGEGWEDRLRDFQSWLYQAVKSDPSLESVPVVGPSIWGRLTADYARLGDISDSVDIANLHYYTGGRRPSVAGAPSSRDEAGGDDEYSLDDAIIDAKTIAPGKPLWITEFGYGLEGPGLPRSKFFITPEASARYILRGVAESFLRGVPRTFVYGFIDDEHRDPPRYHGLLTASLERRPAFDALRNLISLLSNPGEPFPAAELAWAQTGSEVKRLPLLQKRDGRFYLVFWKDVDSYDRGTRSNAEVSPSPVTLEFESQIGAVRIFTPTVSDAVQSEHQGVSSLVLDIHDHLTIAEVVL